MADERGIVEKSISILKDSLNAARDLVLLGLFVLLLTDASKINDLLAEAGFTEGSILGFQWKKQIENSSKQAMDAGQSLAQLQTQLGDYKEKLDEIQKQSSNPAVKASISQLTLAVQNSQSSAQVADRAVKTSLLAQQSIIDQISPATVVTSGWIYLGKVTEDKQSWAPGSPETVSAPSPVLHAGDKLRIRDDVYLRGDAPPGTLRASAPVAAVIRAGNNVNVGQLDYTHAKAGGWFVWAKVDRS